MRFECCRRLKLKVHPPTHPTNHSIHPIHHASTHPFEPPAQSNHPIYPPTHPPTHPITQRMPALEFRVDDMVEGVRAVTPILDGIKGGMGREEEEEEGRREARRSRG